MGCASTSYRHSAERIAIRIDRGESVLVELLVTDDSCTTVDLTGYEVETEIFTIYTQYAPVAPITSFYATISVTESLIRCALGRRESATLSDVYRVWGHRVWVTAPGERVCVAEGTIEFS